MHELSLAQAIADTARKYAGGAPVERVSVRIGHFRQVVPDSLTFSWQLLTEGGDLDGCELAVEHVPAVVRCTDCHAETKLDWPILQCRKCESTDVTLLSGEEFLVASIDLLEVPHGPVPPPR